MHDTPEASHEKPATSHDPPERLETPLARAAEILGGASSLFVLTGAGVSAESGVPTFRDAQTGHWARLDPQTLASPQGFAANPGLVWGWYMSRLAGVEAARPNAGHVALTRLGKRFGEGFSLFTQNVDDLHERAGSHRVSHLHGSIARFHCRDCAAPHALRPEDRAAALPPRCAACGGPIRPGVVWFGEMLPPGLLETASRLACSMDACLVVGTSGVVRPAADLPFAARRAGKPVLEVNPEPTPITEIATVFLPGPSGVVLPRLLRCLGETV
jgi:NAD-dependent deacetylase